MPATTLSTTTRPTTIPMRLSMTPSATMPTTAPVTNNVTIQMPPAPPSAWITPTSVGTCVAIIVSMVAVFLSKRQTKTASDNLRLSLFDRRWKSYAACLSILQKARFGFVENEPIDPFFEEFEDLRTARHLFSDDVMRLIDEVKGVGAISLKHLTDARTAQDSANGLVVFQVERSKLRPRLDKLREELDDAISPLLDFRTL